MKTLCLFYLNCVTCSFGVLLTFTDETENNVTSSTPVPTPTMTPTPCTPDDDHNNIEFPLFTSLLTIAGVIIVILVILVCLLTYCLLRRKQNKCYKLLGCIGSCCCKRRNTGKFHDLILYACIYI